MRRCKYCPPFRLPPVAGEVQLFPNPAREQLFVQLPQSGGAGRLQLRNLLGQLQQEWPALEGEMQDLRLNNIPAGIYLLQWISDTGSASELLFSSHILIE